jgi:hypothetical protein
MKRLVVLFSLALLAALPASADTLADQVRAEAARLLTQVTTATNTTKARPAAKPDQVAPALAADLQCFGLAASRLSVEIDQRGGPTDLRCIFRGMAEETDKQLAAASVAATGEVQAQAYARLTQMLNVMFPRFRGHPNICVPGVRNGQKVPTFHAGVPASDDRAGSIRTQSGEPRQGVRANRSEVASTEVV